MAQPAFSQSQKLREALALALGPQQVQDPQESGTLDLDESAKQKEPARAFYKTKGSAVHITTAVESAPPPKATSAFRHYRQFKANRVISGPINYSDVLRRVSSEPALPALRSDDPLVSKPCFKLPQIVRNDTCIDSREMHRENRAGRRAGLRESPSRASSDMLRRQPSEGQLLPSPTGRSVSSSPLSSPTGRSPTGLGISVKEMDLTGTHLLDSGNASFLCLLEQSRALKRLILVDCGLGRRGPNEFIISEAISRSPGLKECDLSWNALSASACRNLGEIVSRHAALESLGLANNAGPSTPTVALLDALIDSGRQRSLTSLNLAGNGLGGRASAVMEEILPLTALQYLNLSGNPLGAQGMRAVLRGMHSITCDGRNISTFQLILNECYAGDGERVQIWDRHDVAGEHKFSLENTSDQSQLRLLLTFLYDVLELPELLVRVSLDGRSITTPTKSSAGRWEIPSKGVVSALVAKPEWSKLLNLTDSMEAADMTMLAVKKLKRERLTAKAELLSALGTAWRQLHAEVEKMAVLEAISTDFLLPSEFRPLELFAQHQNSEVRLAVMDHLLTAVMPQPSICLNSQVLNDVVEWHPPLYTKLEEFLAFTSANPTGPYELVLSAARDREICRRLLVSRSWELALAGIRGYPQPLFKGHELHARNCFFSGQRMVIEGWHPPQYGILKMDFASQLHPAWGSETISTVAWRRVLLALRRSRLKEESKLSLLRNVLGGTVCVSAAQVVQLQVELKTTLARHLAFVKLYNRVPWHELASTPRMLVGPGFLKEPIPTKARRQKRWQSSSPSMDDSDAWQKATRNASKHAPDASECEDKGQFLIAAPGFVEQSDNSLTPAWQKQMRLIAQALGSPKLLATVAMGSMDLQLRFDLSNPEDRSCAKVLLEIAGPSSTKNISLNGRSWVPNTESISSFEDGFLDLCTCFREATGAITWGMRKHLAARLGGYSKADLHKTSDKALMELADRQVGAEGHRDDEQVEELC